MQPHKRKTDRTRIYGSPIGLPGTIWAQDYDQGGEGVSYHDTGSYTNAGRAYRSDGVDLEPSVDGNNNIGWVAAGEWVNYTVNVGASGHYTVQLRVASPGGDGWLKVGFNRSGVWASVPVRATGGWQAYTTLELPVTLNAGTQVLTLLFETAGFNISKIVVSSGGSGDGGSTGSPAAAAMWPFGGSPWSVPGTIQAEDFDEGGEGVAYHDTSSGNNGGQYRYTGVDIEASSGGYNVAWTAAGEYLNYTVNVTSGGSYTAQLRVASGSGGQMHVGFNGSSVWSAVPVSSTGGWQSWTTVDVPVTLAAGQQVLTLMVDWGSINVDRVAVVAGSGGDSGGRRRRRRRRVHAERLVPHDDLEHPAWEHRLRRPRPVPRRRSSWRANSPTSSRCRRSRPGTRTSRSGTASCWSSSPATRGGSCGRL